MKISIAILVALNMSACFSPHYLGKSPPPWHITPTYIPPTKILPGHPSLSAIEQHNRRLGYAPPQYSAPPDTNQVSAFLAQLQAQQRAQQASAQSYTQFLQQQQAQQQQQEQIRALEGIRDEIHSLPMRQYIWGY
jgi:hypothetical protein